MLKDKVLSVVDGKIKVDAEKFKYRSFRLDKEDYSRYIEFPNREYLIDRYNEFVPTLNDNVFKPQTRRRYIDIEDGIGEDELMKYIGSELRVSSVDDDNIAISYNDVETFDELVTRVYIYILEYARDCYRKEYLEEHT